MAKGVRHGFGEPRRILHFVKRINGRRYRVSTGFADPKSAERRVSEIEYEIRAGILGWRSTVATFADWWKVYRKTYMAMKACPRCDDDMVAHFLRDVDVDFVEEASIQALLDGVSAVDPNGLPGGGGLGLVHGTFDAVVTNWTVELGRGHPAGMWWVSTNAGPQAWLPPQPSALSKVRLPVSMAPSSVMRPRRCSALGPDTLNVMGSDPSGVDFDVARGEVPVEHFGHAIVEVGDVAVERHGHDCDNLRHCDVPFEGWRLRSGDRTDTTKEYDQSIRLSDLRCDLRQVLGTRHAD
jgi:hypothetical protein